MGVMIDTDDMASRLPAWLRVGLVGLLVVTASGAALFAYRYFSQPTTPMLLGGLASVLAALWKFVDFGANGRAASPLDPLYALAGRIRSAENEADLAAVEEELDNILKTELTKHAKGNIQAADAAALSLAAHRLEYLINYRRNILAARQGAIAAE
jgi:hypothetical protein